MRAEITALNPRGTAAFTLVEVLVAIAVLFLMAVMVVGMADGTMKVTSQSNERMGADGGSRQALDRVSADLSRAVVRRDLPIRIEKRVGNDSITFLANAEAYVAGRGISKIGYKVADNGLNRGVEATSWENGTEALQFTTTSDAASSGDYLTIQQANFEPAAGSVFRLELAFLMGDGTIRKEVGTRGPDGSFVVDWASANSGDPAADLHAIIIGLAVIENGGNPLTSGEADALVKRLPDAEDDKEIATVWSDHLSSRCIRSPSASSGVENE